MTHVYRDSKTVIRTSMMYQSQASFEVPSTLSVLSTELMEFFCREYAPKANLIIQGLLLTATDNLTAFDRLDNLRAALPLHEMGNSMMSIESEIKRLVFVGDNAVGYVKTIHDIVAKVFKEKSAVYDVQQTPLATTFYAATRAEELPREEVVPTQPNQEEPVSVTNTLTSTLEEVLKGQSIMSLSKSNVEDFAKNVTGSEDFVHVEIDPGQICDKMESIGLTGFTEKIGRKILDARSNKEEGGPEVTLYDVVLESLNEYDTFAAMKLMALTGAKSPEQLQGVGKTFFSTHLEFMVARVLGDTKRGELPIVGFLQANPEIWGKIEEEANALFGRRVTLDTLGKALEKDKALDLGEFESIRDSYNVNTSENLGQALNTRKDDKQAFGSREATVRMGVGSRNSVKVFKAQRAAGAKSEATTA